MPVNLKYAQCSSGDARIMQGVGSETQTATTVTHQNSVKHLVILVLILMA